MTGKPDVRSLIDSLGVSCEIIEIDPADADTAVFCERYGFPLQNSCNTIVVATRKEPKRYSVCIVQATSRLDVNRRVRGLMGVSRLSFASAEEMREQTGMEVGGVTPFALPPEWPLYVDAPIRDLPWIILGGGGRDFKIKAPPSILDSLDPEWVEDLGKPIRDS